MDADVTPVLVTAKLGKLPLLATDWRRYAFEDSGPKNDGESSTRVIA
jgi:hypothetical protein